MEGATLGHYRISHLIGRGGMGAVYAAQHTMIGRPAAIKVLLPQFSQNQSILVRFFNEAKATGAIRHPGIVEIYDFGTHVDGSAYIVMEFLQGEALSARMERGRMPYPAALAVVRQIAGALAAAHAKNIVHRDLKPDNVFLVPDPEVPGGERIKLLDFGIAKLAGDIPQDQRTRTGSVMGTPTYMAPEQCRGVTVDHRADLYSIGVILFELCAGRPPFVGEGSGDVLAAHIHLQPPALASLAPDVPPPIAQLVHQLLMKSPADRPQTAEQVIQMIDGLSGGMLSTPPFGVGRLSSPAVATTHTPTTLSGAASGKSPTLHKSSRARTIIAAAVLAIAGGAIAFGVVKKGGSTSSKDTTVAATAPATAEPASTPPVATAEPAAPTAEPTQPTPMPAPTPPTPTPAEPTPTPTPPVEAAPATIAIKLGSTPTGADVFHGAKKLGTTPYTGTLPRGDAAVTLTLRKAGHRDKPVTIKPTAAIDETIKLEPKPRGATTPRTNRDQSVNPFGN